jgi:Spy/CpxP family protein refolding chaperone
MDIFEQKKQLWRVVLVLITLNIISIGVFLWKGFSPQNGPPDSPAHMPREPRELSSLLEKELNLTAEQAEQIKALRSGLFEKEKILAAAIRAERDSMNELMFNQVTDEALVKALAKRVADNEYKMEMLRFEQATELKAICTPEQLKKFEGLVREIRDYLKPEGK